MVGLLFIKLEFYSYEDDQVYIRLSQVISGLFFLIPIVAKEDSLAVLTRIR